MESSGIEVKSNFFERTSAWSAVSATPNSGYGILFSFSSVEKLPLSSAKSKAAYEVTIILIPYFVCLLVCIDNIIF